MSTWSLLQKCNTIKLMWCKALSLSTLIWLRIWTKKISHPWRFRGSRSIRGGRVPDRSTGDCRKNCYYIILTILDRLRIHLLQSMNEKELNEAVTCEKGQIELRSKRIHSRVICLHPIFCSKFPFLAVSRIGLHQTHLWASASNP